MSVPKPPARNETITPVPRRGEELRVRHADQRLRFASRINAPRPLAFWHLASLDAPTIAAVWALGFGWVAGVRLPFWIPLLFALAVWSVYVGDRLLDVRAGSRDGHSDRLQERHYFHWRHRRTLLPMAIAAACSAALIIWFFMPVAARERDSLLAAAALTYFACVHSGRRPHPFLAPLLTKELLVGVLFTLGCALPTLQRTPALLSVLSWPVLGTMVFFALLAWLNCSMIDFWESGLSWDLRPNGRSLLFAACLLAGVGGILGLGSFAVHPRAATLFMAGAASAVLLAWLDGHRGRLGPVALRACADLALLTPALFIPITRIPR